MQKYFVPQSANPATGKPVTGLNNDQTTGHSLCDGSDILGSDPARAILFVDRIGTRLAQILRVFGGVEV